MIRRVIEVMRTVPTWRLRLHGTAIVVALAVAFMVFVMTADGVESLFGGRVGGDYPAFHTAGVIVRDHPDALFDIDAQAELQAPFIDDGFLPYPYPPPTAWIYAPVSLLPFVAGYTALVVMAVIVVAAAVRGLLTLMPKLARDPRLVLIGTFAYAGTFRAVGGVQTSTWILGSLVSGWVLRGSGHRLASGLMLGVLWLKPHFALPVMGLLLLNRGFREVAGMVVVAVGLFVVGWQTYSLDWITRWSQTVLAYTDAGNRAHNTMATISPVELARGIPSPTGDVLAVVIGLLVVAWSVRLWLRAHDDGERLAIASVTLLLIAPHALQYELILLVPAIGVLLDRHGRSLLPQAFGWWLLGIVALLPVPPIVRVLGVVWVAYEVTRLVDGVNGQEDSTMVAAGSVA